MYHRVHYCIVDLDKYAGQLGQATDKYDICDNIGLCPEACITNFVLFGSGIQSGYMPGHGQSG